MSEKKIKYQMLKVEESLHRKLKAKAARAGMPLQDYVQAKLEAAFAKEKDA